MIGALECIYNSTALMSVMTITCCTLAKLDRKVVVDATNTPNNQVIQQRCLFKLTKYLIWNPFDRERDYVVTKLKRNADYLMNMPDDILSEIYYRSIKEMVGIESTIFDVGQKCKEIIVVLSGVIEISLSDGL